MSLACIQPSTLPQGQPVFLYCDGACDTTRRTGGWAVILRFGNREHTESGHAHDTTNNRMELFALLAGLRILKYPCSVHVVTDSQYLRKAFTDGWILKWQKNGWQSSSRQPVKNQDLWEELIEQARIHSLTFEWTKGHAGHEFNERVDQLAVRERKKLSV